MPKYLFTSDQRISDLPNRIKWVAKFIKGGHDLSELDDKSDNNNAATLKFYYNLQPGTETCLKSSKDPLFGIRNFVLKFQFPNARTSESLTDSIEEKTLFAPFRSVVIVLYKMAQKSEDLTAEISINEVLYFLFCNPYVYKNPLVDYDKVIRDIQIGRKLGDDLENKIASVIEWKQFVRQSRELFTVLNYASSCFKVSKGNISFSMNSESYEKDKDFIDQIIEYSKFWFPSDSTDFNLSTSEYISYMDTKNTPYNVVDFKIDTHDEKSITANQPYMVEEISDSYRPYITAIKSKPFLLLAGISGTGKSRIVRELARACWEVGSDEFKAHKPSNFEMVQVKPNWHDSSELIGYVSRVSGEPVFVAGDFLKFVAKAWENPDVPYFLCLDEMNLAPVEQYFAEYLSVVESRKLDGDKVVTDPILKKETEQWYHDLVCKQLTENDNVQDQFLAEGICIPQNLIVVGTVNMDETTFSFSRKVLDRAMTIEMNEVDLNGGLSERHEQIGKLGAAELIGNAVEGVDVYKAYKDVCDKVISYLKEVNGVLEGTPFKIAYRTRNEFLLYVVNNLPYNKDEDGNELDEGFVIARALDEITSMKILSRIEGDESKVKEDLLTKLKETIKDELHEISDKGWAAKETENEYKSVSMAKLEEMIARLKTSGYTSFWS